MNYLASEDRYDKMPYNRCGDSGLKLPQISLGLWHNFGGVDDYETSRKIVLESFNLGITHFDLANNYGPPGGSAEETLGKILHGELSNHRDELIISTKAGHYMWEGPYGDWGSRKHLISSLDQSLKRMNLEYVDIFYHHRMDQDTPLEETMAALAHIVKQGKALYVGLSKYSPAKTKEAADILKRMGVRCLIHQFPYNILFREYEQAGLIDVLADEGIGSINFSPLAQGLLSDRYLHGIPEDSRAQKEHGFLQKDRLTDDLLSKIRKLNALAMSRGQTLAQMAVTWCLSVPKVTSVLVGASRVEQIQDTVKAVAGKHLSQREIDEIESIVS